MERGEAIPGRVPVPSAPRGWSRTLGVLNPLRAVWWLFTNVRFAVVLLVLLCGLSLLGVVLPQKPLPVRGDVVAEANWVRVQEGKFGFLTDPLDETELFDVFHARWFGILLTLTAASTGAYVISRLPGAWRAITQPRKRVPDRYFETAPNRLEVAGGLDAGRLEEALRRSRYRVERFDEADASNIFADRFAWAQLGTLFTHAAVIVFVLAAVVSRADAFSSPLFLAEGSTLPIFPVRDPNQMQVELRDAKAQFAADGQALDYRSEIAIYRRGEEVRSCTSTVNSPCSFAGYKFYQSAYFGFGAALQVRDLQTGNTIYRETLALSGTAKAPHVTVRDGAGAVLLDETLVLTDELVGRDFTYRGTLVRLPSGRLISVGLQTADNGDERLAVLEPGAGDGLLQLSLAEGESGESGGLQVSYQKAVAIPYALVPELPVPLTTGEDGASKPALQLSNVVYGTDKTSEGTTTGDSTPAGPPLLTLTGLKAQAVKLHQGESVRVGDYQYSFLGQREFAGITVKRDRSDYLIWAGAALIVAGLAATFWVPRRRFWAKITATRTLMAGQAPAHARYARELRRLAHQAGSARDLMKDDD
jgi:cytochrome c biogenesis protein ResB